MKMLRSAGPRAAIGFDVVVRGRRSIRGYLNKSVSTDRITRPGPMATSGRSTGVVDYNVQIATDTSSHHFIVTDEVLNVGRDRTEPWSMACQGAGGSRTQGHRLDRRQGPLQGS